MSFANKVIINNEVVIDLTSDTVTADKLLKNYTAHDRTGAIIEGTYEPASPAELQSKSVSPTESVQTIVPDVGYDGLSSVTVSGISTTYVGSGVGRKTSSDLTVSGSTVTAPAGYYGSSASKSVASGSVSNPTASKGSVSNHQVTITPSVTSTTGYITGSTKSGTGVTVSASELVSGSQTISQNGTVDVTNLASVTVDVQSSGSSKNVQCYQGYKTIKTTSYTDTGVSLTVEKTGTYTVSWMAYRNTTSGTSGTQLYIDNTAYGSVNTSWVNSYGQSVTLSNVSLTQGQTIAVRARARSTTYYVGVGNLCIVEN